MNCCCLGSNWRLTKYNNVLKSTSYPKRCNTKLSYFPEINKTEMEVLRKWALNLCLTGPLIVNKYYLPCHTLTDLNIPLIINYWRLKWEQTEYFLQKNWVIVIVVIVAGGKQSQIQLSWLLTKSYFECFTQK